MTLYLDNKGIYFYYSPKKILCIRGEESQELNYESVEHGMYTRYYIKHYYPFSGDLLIIEGNQTITNRSFKIKHVHEDYLIYKEYAVVKRGET